MTEDETWEISFPAYRLEAFNAKISTANRRLAKAGADVRFTPTIEHITCKRIVGGIELPDGTRMFGTTVEEPWVTATLTDVTLALGDYTFIAALVREQAGYTVHCAPGHNLDGWTRPPADDMHCDHCGTKRIRNRLYVVRNNVTGELVQLGHGCISLFTGLSVRSLSALTFDDELKAFAAEDNDGRSFGQGDYGVDVRKVIAYAWTFTDHGRSYVSTVNAWGDRPSTVSVVRSALFVPPRPPHRATAQAMAAYHEYLDALREADRCYREDGELITDILNTVNTVDAGTDYGQNLRVILAGEYVSGRNVGILASLVAVYAKERELAVKRAAAPKSAAGYLAEVGVRIRTELRITLGTVRYWEGDYGTTTFLVGRTDDQHTVTWKASGTIDAETGDVLVLSAATVKAHEQYKETDQTVLTRCKVARIESHA